MKCIGIDAAKYENDLFLRQGFIKFKKQTFMNPNPIVLYIDANNNHSFLNYTQDPEKISKNINHLEKNMPKI